jgi:hypothetical protein
VKPLIIAKGENALRRRDEPDPFNVFIGSPLVVQFIKSPQQDQKRDAVRSNVNKPIHFSNYRCCGLPEVCNFVSALCPLFVD